MVAEGICTCYFLKHLFHTCAIAKVFLLINSPVVSSLDFSIGKSWGEKSLEKLEKG